MTDNETLQISSFIISLLSICGCLIMITSYWFIYDLRKIPAYRLILHLAISNLLLTINGFLTTQIPSGTLDPTFCYYWGMFRQYVTVAAFCWPFMFGYVLYKFFHGKYRSSREINNNFKYFSLFCWGLPIIFTIIPLLFDAYGDAGLYCWISTHRFNQDPDEYVTIVFVSFYLPIFILGILVFFYYLKIMLIVCRTRKEERPPVLELLFYPALFLITVLITALDRFWDINTLDDVQWMIMAHMFIRQSQGFLNFIGYGMSARVRAALFSPCMKQPQNQHRSSSGLNISLQEISISTSSSRTGSFNNSLTIPSVNIQRNSF